VIIVGKIAMYIYIVEVEAVLALGPAQRLWCNSRLPDQ